jgi:polyhydroxyalkanoate synthase
MSAHDHQAQPPAWMAQLPDPNNWQHWLQSPQLTASAPSVPPDLAVALDPATVNRLQQDYMQEFSALWQAMLASKDLAIKDKRFASPAWHDNALYSFNAAIYLLNARFLMSMVDAVQAPHKTRQKIRFALQQTIDAMSPSNFLASNPDAQQKIIESNGESLAKGIAHMLHDMQKGRISQTDETAFEVGRNVATTEGAVVFENELFQLIQYKPLTKTVAERPLLLVPPCINKYYIMDLQPSNSLVRYTVEQGHTVFLVSWRNADMTNSHATWDNYVQDGAIKAIKVVQDISGQDQINALGFCVGGTIIATALAYLFARGEKPIASLTLLTALLDFSDTGAIDVFIDEEQVKKREQDIGGGGLMPGRDFTAAFSALRPNDLVWNYVESNYLKGENPPPFDLLYWNADSTNLPGPMFCWYLRNLYLENNLMVPGKTSVAGKKIDLGKISAPTFIYASREDHIVPWSSAYASLGLLNPKKPDANRFILGASGHIAGVINPPAKKKRSYWTNEKSRASADAWLEGAKEHPGSWWPEWSAFLAKHAGQQVAAPSRYGNAKFKPLEPAPGRYVKVKV